MLNLSSYNSLWYQRVLCGNSTILWVLEESVGFCPLGMQVHSCSLYVWTAAAQRFFYSVCRSLKGRGHLFEYVASMEGRTIQCIANFITLIIVIKDEENLWFKR